LQVVAEAELLLERQVLVVMVAVVLDRHHPLELRELPILVAVVEAVALLVVA
jgi:hypothetical protein